MLHTKKDFIDCLAKIVNPIKDYYTEGKAGIKCGSTGVQYGEEIALLEGFARVLWGLSPFGVEVAILKDLMRFMQKALQTEQIQSIANTGEI